MKSFEERAVRIVVETQTEQHLCAMAYPSGVKIKGWDRVWLSMEELQTLRRWITKWLEQARNKERHSQARYLRSLKEIYTEERQKQLRNVLDIAADVIENGGNDHY